ncbi:Gfo/Idh/MocA family protein [Pelagicoccus mobilis]|uniref:Gfo/Idh/MocA family oxidoreductase n=1 Tax=Pelagicoccus mobilis TaxID=415221 RepID=A0A934VTX6_9BACT|nr:Gfo/Idh/MocA family oxidoreductase [Pelagicoccus mobilis]MBK1880178.1 Gfo/Idh/MocA family oxidoreductase [Pelagicoccus mobilis]
MKTTVPTRRSFLKASLTAGIAPLILPSRIFGKNAPSKQIQLGFIGVGGHGTEFNLKNFLRINDCRAVSVCDVFRDRRENAAKLINETYENTDCRTANDFRELLADPSIDAVVISTPDHWHVPMSQMALAAGKHVFCEKPTYTIREGRALERSVANSGLTFATGLEDRSLSHYHKMVEWVRNGAIGDLQHMEVTLPPGSIHPADEEAPVPDGLDWNLWLGPAPFHPYTPTRTGWLNWRYIRDYSTGVLTDWGTHLVDTAQLAANDPHGCVVEAEGWGAELPQNSQSDIPAEYEVNYRYSNGITMQVKNAVDEKWLGAKASIKLIGNDGWVSITGWRGTFDASDPKILRTKYRASENKHWPIPPGEHRNFIDCIRSGKTPTYSAETLHLLSTTLHMGLIAMDTGRKLNWDPKTEQFIRDSDANKRLDRTLRDWE